MIASFDPSLQLASIANHLKEYTMPLKTCVHLFSKCFQKSTPGVLKLCQPKIQNGLCLGPPHIKIYSNLVMGGSARNWPMTHFESQSHSLRDTGLHYETKQQQNTYTYKFNMWSFTLIWLRIMHMYMKSCLQQQLMALDKSFHVQDKPHNMWKYFKMIFFRQGTLVHTVCSTITIPSLKL